LLNQDGISAASAVVDAIALVPADDAHTPPGPSAPESATAPLAFSSAAMAMSRDSPARRAACGRADPQRIKKKYQNIQHLAHSLSRPFSMPYFTFFLYYFDGSVYESTIIIVLVGDAFGRSISCTSRLCSVMRWWRWGKTVGRCRRGIS
jgi:hypothetical protein